MNRCHDSNSRICFECFFEVFCLEHLTTHHTHTTHASPGSHSHRTHARPGSHSRRAHARPGSHNGASYTHAQHRRLPKLRRCAAYVIGIHQALSAVCHNFICNNMKGTRLAKSMDDARVTIIRCPSQCDKKHNLWSCLGRGGIVEPDCAPRAGFALPEHPLTPCETWATNLNEWSWGVGMR